MVLITTLVGALVGAVLTNHVVGAFVGMTIGLFVGARLRPGTGYYGRLARMDRDIAAIRSGVEPDQARKATDVVESAPTSRLSQRERWLRRKQRRPPNGRS